MKIARIDLSKPTVSVRNLSGEYESYIGGKGVATKLLFEVPAKIDPFSPENAIVFGVGPLNGINISGASRMTCVFKSPMTDGYGESQCGGFIGYELKRTGIDFLFITGKAEKPVYLLVENESIEIRDASDLWGKDSFETEDILRKDHGGEVLSIGQAGENLVRFACINHRKGRQFGRGGAGAVMGSKNLKAIVVKGNNEIEIAYPDEFKEFRKWLNGVAREKLKSMTEYGTPGIMALTNEAGVLPTKYWSEGSFGGFESINAEALKKYVKKSKSCYGCVVACGKISRVNDTEVEGPEYETLYAFGSLCYNDNLESIIMANELCDRYGMDTISAGNVIAFLMANRKLEFGDSDAILDLVKKIAFREGIGDSAAEGTKRLAEIMNSEVEPVHVKGLEPAGYDPRGLYGIALGYATSPRGACHMRSCAYRPNLAGVIDKTSTDQAKMVKDYEDLYCVVDSLVFCRFLCLPIIGMYWEDIARLYRIVTGKEVKVDELKKVGERISNLTREFNLREGVNDYRLPSLFSKPIKHYDKELVIKKEDFEKMLDEYFRLRGW